MLSGQRYFGKAASVSSLRQYSIMSNRNVPSNKHINRAPARDLFTGFAWGVTGASMTRCAFDFFRYGRNYNEFGDMWPIFFMCSAAITLLERTDDEYNSKYNHLASDIFDLKATGNHANLQKFFLDYICDERCTSKHIKMLLKVANDTQSSDCLLDSLAQLSSEHRKIFFDAVKKECNQSECNAFLDGVAARGIFIKNESNDSAENTSAPRLGR